MPVGAGGAEAEHGEGGYLGRSPHDVLVVVRRAMQERSMNGAEGCSTKLRPSVPGLLNSEPTKAPWRGRANNGPIRLQSIASRMLLSTAALTATATSEGPPSKRSAIALLPLVDELVADEVDAPVPELAIALEPGATLEEAADAELAAASVVAAKVGVVPRS